MPAYVSLINFTDQGVRNAKDTVNRARAFEKVLEEAGARKIGFWWTMGQYDLVAITEAPDDETAVRLALRLSMSGNVRTTTLRAFSEDETINITQGLG